ncbi:MAG: carboxypeptidase-like regulatory domain-containing protein [Paludibaculum sp.]
MKLLVAVLLSSCAATAQVSSGTFFGEVRDASHALVPGAHVVARSAATGFVRTTVTNDSGSYSIDGLAAGSYSVRAEKPGFQVTVAREAVLEVNQKGRARLRTEARRSKHFGGCRGRCVAAAGLRCHRRCLL